MDHVAIMTKSLGFIPKILSGEKKIESRWYLSRKPPWNRIKRGDVVYFKNSGEPVTIKAQVAKVIQFDGLNQQKVRKILKDYGGKGGIALNNLSSSFTNFRSKKYCVLVFLKNPKEVKPFNIDKAGFGISSAWVCVENINSIKIKKI